MIITMTINNTKNLSTNKISNSHINSTINLNNNSIAPTNNNQINNNIPNLLLRAMANIAQETLVQWSSLHSLVTKAQFLSSQKYLPYVVKWTKKCKLCKKKSEKYVGKCLKHSALMKISCDKSTELSQLSFLVKLIALKIDWINKIERLIILILYHLLLRGVLQIE